MSDVDLVILAFIGLSAVMSLFRGMFHEALNLAVWLGAILVTLYYSSRFAALLPIDAVQSPVARASISGVTLFLGTLFVGGILKWLLGKMLASSTQGFVDRVSGLLFGAARGAVMASLLVLAANLAPELKNETWWQESVLIPRLQSIASFIHARLPESLSEHFDII